MIKQWSATWAVIALSSGEAETKAITKGAVEGLYLKHLLQQQGFIVDIVLHSDASAAIGACNRIAGHGATESPVVRTVAWNST